VVGLSLILLTLRAARNPPHGLIELLGNVTVLERPLAATSLKSAVRAALRARVRQRQTAIYLHQLQDLTNTLERRVDERTQQLADANRRLRTEMAERQRTELALRLEALGQLTGGIAHDFNNLLTTITGNLQLLDTRIENEHLQRLVRNAMHGAERGAKLVKQLMAFSRKQDLSPGPVDINELAGVVAELLSPKRSCGRRWLMPPSLN
jgi:signal transduction histidine kinase